MGKNEKLTPNPELARSHAAGASVAPIQTLVHAQLGTIAYIWPRLWTYHYESSYDAYEQLTELHKQLVTFPVSSVNMRLITDQAFLKSIYKVGTSMVSDVVRTIQHFTEEIERTTQRLISGTTVNDRLREAVAAAGLDLDLTDPGYAALVEMQLPRDAIEHPKENNVYAGLPGEWDKVPLAWLLSDRSVRAFDRYNEWFESLAQAWEAKRDSYTQPADLQVERGLGSRYPFKKPPKP
jgi:hypothetical protein